MTVDSESGKDFIEMRIMGAVQKLLTDKCNELLGKIEYVIPLVEFSNYGGNTVVVPSLALSTCELSEKERIIRLAAYTLTITFNVPERGCRIIPFSHNFFLR
jgi:hypothetical protein